MVINATVAKWYYERKQSDNKLFKACNKRSVSIHTIVNLNGGIDEYKIRTFFGARNNDINLLRLVRKNGSRFKDYFFKFRLDTGHKRRYYNFKKWLKKIS